MLFDITSLLSKDKLVAQALRSLIEAQLDGLGAVSGIDFNSSAKSLSVTLDMTEEPRPVVVNIDSYSIQPGSSGTKLIIHEYSSPSHDWLARLAKKFQPSFEFDLPVPYMIAKNIT
jgi:hypothetical protein